MKRTFLRILALVLLFIMLFSTTALAAMGYCTKCGKYTSLTNYLCSSCNSSSIRITKVTENDNGTVTMTWSDAKNNGPYTVRHELADSAPSNFHWYDESKSKSYTFGWLAPGVEYEFYVEDSKGNESSRYSFTPRSSVYNRHGTSISIQPYLGGKTCSRFSKATLTKQLNSSQISMTMKVNYSRLAYPRSYRYRVVVTAPNGFAHAVWAGDINMPSGRTYWTEKGINLNDYFSLLDKYYYGIPTGTYTVTLVYDQETVCSDTFIVGG